MEWTPELDALLTDLHRKRLGNTFIASWMHLKSADVRARLAALGLVKPPAPKPAEAPTRKETRAATLDHADDGGTGDADHDDNDDDMVRYRGRPRGYLMSAEKINSLYRSIGRSY